MKGVKIPVAVLILLMLSIPMISIPIKADVQQSNTKNSKITQNPIKSVQTFKILDTSTGQVNQISSFDYICGVLAAEMPASYPIEALKAQAAASFTYACYKRESNLSNPASNVSIKGADLSDDSSKFEAYLTKAQAKARWGSQFEAKWDKIEQAVSDVENKVMVYNGRPIAAVFFSLSSGMTESSGDVWGSSLPYLTEVDSKWDRLVPGFETRVTVTAKDFRAEVKSEYSRCSFDKDPRKWITNIKRSRAGGVISADICGNTVGGQKIRQLFGLRSANFQVSFKNPAFTFVVRGNGHGVGMSQHGADYLAARGKSWEEILLYYYKGVRIENYHWQD